MKIHIKENTRKWKHNKEDNLFDGTSHPTQQIQLGSVYWKQQARKPIFTTELAKFNKRKAKEDRQRREEFNKWAVTKGEGLVEKSQKDYLTTSNDNTWVENRNPTVKASKPKNPHLTERSVRGAKAHAAWVKAHPNLDTWGTVLGAVPFAVAAAPLAATAGSGIAALGDAVAATSASQAITAGLTPLTTAASTNIAGAPLYTWADVGLSSLFGAHGIQTAIDEGGISPTTALEIAPLGRLVKPMWDAGKQGLQYATKAIDNATRYASPSYDLYKTVDETPIINRSFPTKSLYRADVYKGGEIKDSNNISLTTDPKYAEQYGEVTPYLFESNSIAKAKEPLMGYSDPVNNDMFIYHNTKDAPGANAIVGHDLVTGEFPYNSKGTEIISLSPNNIYPKSLGTPTIKWRDATRIPQITSENAASITPEQWDAAYRAAYKAGDKAEGQRLWNLWFKQKAPNAVTTTGKKVPQTLYHTGRDNILTFKIPKSLAKIAFDDPYRTISWAKKEGYNIDAEELAKYNNGETAIVHKPTGVYLSDDLVTSKTYLGKEADVNTTYPLFVNLENPLISVGKGEQLYSDTSSVKQLQKAIDKGNDGVFLKNIKDYGPNDAERMVNGVWQDSPSTSVVVFDPRRIKSAKPFTTADDGSLIDLTKRANFTNPDIRYKRGDVLVEDEWGTDLYSYPEYIKYRISKLKQIVPDKIKDYTVPKLDPGEVNLKKEQLISRDNFIRNNIGFNPMAIMSMGKNLKTHLWEINRRLSKLYPDLPKYVTEGINNAENTPFIIGYFNEPNILGFHSYMRGINLVEPAPKSNLPRNMLHEGVMHGTDSYMTDKIANAYLLFINKIYESPYIENRIYTKNNWSYKAPEGTECWEEGRATFGEIRKFLYDKISKDNNILFSTENMDKLIPIFEKTVDKLNTNDVTDLLNKTGGYGEVYGTIGPKANSNFLKDSKDLLKYMPATLPFLIPKRRKRNDVIFKEW